MKTIDVGPLFFSPCLFETTMDSMPLYGTLPSQETDPPFRNATVLFVRVPFTKFGGFIGLWKQTSTDPDQALMNAIAGHGFDLDDQIDDEDKRTVRALVAEHTQDWDDEWQILNVLGLDQ